MSLGNLTLLLEELWAFALLKSGLAEPRKSAEGGWTIRSSEGVWKALLEGGGWYGYLPVAARMIYIAERGLT